MKNLIIIIVVIIAVVAAFYIFTANNTLAPALETEQGAEASSGTTLSEMPSGEDAVTSGINQDSTDTAVSANTVSYTTGGFSPSVLTIQKGDTVVFENESGPNMWVASAQHPTHTVYPEKTDADCLGSAFDACEGVSPGNSWSFTFNEVGEWGYHNHLRANHWGRVIVE